MLTEYTYYISEYFQSIQGEGNFAGVNSFFIRFQHCNLRCCWCDSKFTWNKYSGTHKLFNQAELQKVISENQAEHVIFTGGEPTLYQLDKLVLQGKKFHVESNGTINPSQSLNIRMEDGTVFCREAMDERIISEFNWVISPKLSNSFQEINDEAIVFFAKKEFSVFKFVAKNSADLNEISRFATNYSIARHKVFVGLEGTTLESQIRPEMVEDIISSGFNFSPRLHVMLWGNTRGK
jgi:organic radical activating enzyme